MSIGQSPSSYSFLFRDAERARRLAQQAQDYVQAGKTSVQAQTVSDETTFHVTFSNVFAEEPLFTFGGGLDQVSPAVSGSFPTVSAVVIDWDIIAVGPFEGYSGATIGVVTTGTVTQKLWVHYMFTGKALSFNAGQVPTGGSVTV